MGSSDVPDFLCTMLMIVDSFIVRYFQDGNMYYKGNPAARDAIVTEFQEVTRLTLLPTPALTSRNEAVSTPLPSQNVAQEYEDSLATRTNRRSANRAHLAFHDQDKGCCLSDPNPQERPLNKELGMEPNNTRHTIRTRRLQGCAYG